MNHRWSSPSRPSLYETTRTCTRCGILRVTRHEGVRHWLEWRDTDGRRIGSITAGYVTLAPKCEGMSDERENRRSGRQ